MQRRSWRCRCEQLLSTCIKYNLCWDECVYYYTCNLWPHRPCWLKPPRRSGLNVYVLHLQTKWYSSLPSPWLLDNQLRHDSIQCFKLKSPLHIQSFSILAISRPVLFFVPRDTTSLLILYIFFENTEHKQQHSHKPYEMLVVPCSFSRVFLIVAVAFESTCTEPQRGSSLTTPSDRN